MAERIEEFVKIGTNQKRELAIFQHLPLSGELTFDVATLPIGSETERVCTNLTAHQARQVRDVLDRWLAGGAS